MLDDKSLAPSFRCQKKNSKRIDLERGQYASLVTVLTDAMSKALSFKPQDEKSPATLRKTYEPVYGLLAPLAGLAFDRSISPVGMFNLSIDGFDLQNGFFIVSFVYEEARERVRYQLQIYNHLAPYTEEWPKLLMKHGGDPKPFSFAMGLV